ncbi:unnamed protein product [Diamesa serratosioi]
MLMMLLVVFVTSSKIILKPNRPIHRIPSQISTANTQIIKLKKFESKAASMGLSGPLIAQFLNCHRDLLDKLKELKHVYEEIKVLQSNASPMKSLVNTKFHEIHPHGYRKVLPRQTTQDKSTKQQHKRPKDVWDFMELRG